MVPGMHMYVCGFTRAFAVLIRTGVRKSGSRRQGFLDFQRDQGGGRCRLRGGGGEPFEGACYFRVLLSLVLGFVRWLVELAVILVSHVIHILQTVSQYPGWILYDSGFYCRLLVPSGDDGL